MENLKKQTSEVWFLAIFPLLIIGLFTLTSILQITFAGKLIVAIMATIICLLIANRPSVWRTHANSISTKMGESTLVFRNLLIVLTSMAYLLYKIETHYLLQNLNQYVLAMSFCIMVLTFIIRVFTESFNRMTRSRNKFYSKLTEIITIIVVVITLTISYAYFGSLLIWVPLGTLLVFLFFWLKDPLVENYLWPHGKREAARSMVPISFFTLIGFGLVSTIYQFNSEIGGCLTGLWSIICDGWNYSIWNGTLGYNILKIVVILIISIAVFALLAKIFLVEKHGYLNWWPTILTATGFNVFGWVIAVIIHFQNTSPNWMLELGEWHGWPTIGYIVLIFGVGTGGYFLFRYFQRKILNRKQLLAKKAEQQEEEAQWKNTLERVNKAEPGESSWADMLAIVDKYKTLSNYKIQNVDFIFEKISKLEILQLITSISKKKKTLYFENQYHTSLEILESILSCTLDDKLIESLVNQMESFFDSIKYTKEYQGYISLMDVTITKYPTVFKFSQKLNKLKINHEALKKKALS